ncbi:protein Wnt-7b-like isoform X2 [Acropora muricata]|uniref:protein Wnt-7b-like isoform X2 n=1 Tax=Acropora millepora TaxID=45264 RepID=UPI0010FCA5BA|nr:protein Wnt-7b-like isoform X2 [Acropora millepora]
MGICQAIVTIGLLLATVIANHLMKANKLFVVSSVATEIRPSMICSRIPGLSPKQKNICEEHPELINCIREGYQKGADECKFQFRKNRWNCSLLGQISAFDDRAIPGTKEAAFTQAITSAGVVYTISRACSMGNLSECHCDRKWIGKESKRGWSWGGCSVDINYGINLSSRFVNARRNRHDDIFLMDRHNSKAGRQALKETLEIQCRCHGTSQSCATRTCWQSLPSSFRKVGLLLKERYKKIVLVKPNKISSHYGKRDAYLTLSSDIFKKPLQRELAYIKSSPNYCDRDAQNRIPGTTERVCNRTSTEEDNCKLLCCGRGYNTHEIVRRYRCRCKFHWCCYVKCHKCKERMEVFKCK